MKTLSTRERHFVREYALCGVGERAAIKAGYSLKTARQQGYRLLTKDYIKSALTQLADKADSSAIMTIQERKERLSQIIREVMDAKISDYIKVGASGTSIIFGPESPNPKSIRKIKARTESCGDIAAKTKCVLTDIDLVDLDVAIKAIDVLNKMDGVYRETESGILTVELNVYGANGRPMKRPLPCQPLPLASHVSPTV